MHICERGAGSRADRNLENRVIAYEFVNGQEDNGHGSHGDVAWQDGKS